MNGTGGFLQPEEIIRQLNIKKWMKIADFGCGAGYFTIPLAKKVGNEGRVYALDVLETALESVRSRAKIQGLFNIETIRCNLEVSGGSSLANNSIDLVVMANILFQSSGKIDIIKEAERVLKEKGELIIVDWESDRPVGPAKEFIVSVDKIKTIAESQGLKFKRKPEIDKYHWGMIFEK